MNVPGAFMAFLLQNAPPTCRAPARHIIRRNRKMTRTPARRAMALALALALALTMWAIPAAASSEEAAPALTLSADAIAISETGQSITATLTVPAALAGSDPAAWASGLTWSMTREESFQDEELYPYYYTGDELTAWTSWGTDGTDGEAYFSVTEPEVSAQGGTVTVSLTFTTAVPFMATEEGENALQISGSVPSRNVYECFIGDYDLTVSSGDEALASQTVTVNVYETYLTYAEIIEELLAIQETAAENGRYMDITVYGESEGGYPLYYVTFSDSESSVTAFQEMNELALTDPASLQEQIADGQLDGEDYRVPFLINNVHPDENPGVDAQINLLRELASADTITYNTLTGLASGEEVDTTLFDAQVASIEGFTGLGSRKISGSEENGNNDGVTDASEYYTISEDLTLDVEELLDNIILLVIPNENPDGRTYNTRRNANGFDLNRDASNQTQAETYYLYQVVSSWNPVVFAELHGYMDEFLVEPCTPPHEPNLEYDLLVENFLRGAEAFGSAALATMSAQEDFDMKFQSYYTPLRDDYTEGEGWSAWDDLCTNYGPSYAMLNCGSLGYTIETPTCNEACTRLLECGMYGLLAYVMEYKDDIYLNQLEFFRRGIENEDHAADMESWYVSMDNETLESGTWRVAYEETGNFFPEYYVIPVDADSQRDTADAYEMADFLTRNGVQVRELTEDVTVDGVTYLAGSLVVDMYQAKRNYANTVLWAGADASSSGFPDLYSESVSNFPEMRGFDCDAVTAVGAFEGLLSDPLTDIQGQSQLSGAGEAVILSNSGTEAVRAVNALLAAGATVGYITEGDYAGDFLISAASYETVSAEYVLTATAVEELPTAYAIQAPTLYLTGRYDSFSGYTVTEGYYAQWFSEGYGFINYRNVQQNGTSNQDLFAFETQLGFTITSDPAGADVILGSVSLDQGESGQAAVEAVASGTPYIAMGSSPLAYISQNLLSGMTYQTLGMEALHTVTYPSDSLITASQAADGDYVIYTYGCAVITTLPDGAEVLIQAAEEDSFLAGCCLNEEGLTMDGFVEAFAIETEGMDITVFANSIVNRAHQQDDYTFVTNAIYSKCLTGDVLTAADL